MRRIPQGGGSSPSGPTITKRDRQQLKWYDRYIDGLKSHLKRSVEFGPSRATTLSNIQRMDMKRLRLRLWMKGLGEK